MSKTGPKDRKKYSRNSAQEGHLRNIHPQPNFAETEREGAEGTPDVEIEPGGGLLVGRGPFLLLLLLLLNRFDAGRITCEPNSLIVSGISQDFCSLLLRKFREVSLLLCGVPILTFVPAGISIISGIQQDFCNKRNATGYM